MRLASGGRLKCGQMPAYGCKGGGCRAGSEYRGGGGAAWRRGGTKMGANSLLREERGGLPPGAPPPGFSRPRRSRPKLPAKTVGGKAHGAAKQAGREFRRRGGGYP